MSLPLLFTYTGDDWQDLLPEISARTSLATEEEHDGSLTFLDTLTAGSTTPVYVLARTQEAYELSERATGAMVARATAADVAAVRVDDLPAAVPDVLKEVVGVRALLKVARVQSRCLQLAARNSEQKTVARLELTDSYLSHAGRKTALNRRISVAPLRGYEKAAVRLSEQVAQVANVQPAAVSVFEESVAGTGRSPGDYSSGLSLKLRRDMPAFDAAKLLYSTLLEAMEANQDGVVQDIESEFLHDLRVAVRRTRSALKEGEMLSVEVESRFREEFRWLGQVTSPTRDLDVYLLELPAFDDLIGGANADLEPLRKLIAREKRRAHARLRRTLLSVRYQRLREDWRDAVDADSPTARRSRRLHPHWPVGRCSNPQGRTKAAARWQPD